MNGFTMQSHPNFCPMQNYLIQKLEEPGNKEELKDARDILANSFFSPIEVQSAGPDIFGDSSLIDISSNYMFKKQFAQYLACVKEMMHDGTSCLEWWRKNKEDFPLVAFVARSILSAQASSAETERLFSTAGYIISKYRTRLTGSRADKLILLSKFLKTERIPIPEDETAESEDDDDSEG